MDIDIAVPPTYDGQRLLHACDDPYGSGAHVFLFSDETALVVSAAGTHSRWVEEGWEVGSLSRGPRRPWTWVPAIVRVEVWPRAVELDPAPRVSVGR